MRCHPISDGRRANPPKMGTHGGDYDVDGDGGGKDIGRRWRVWVEEHRAESGGWCY